MKKERNTDTVVVGSGPGGATVARELARAGKDVLLLEKGRHHQWPVGTPLAYATMYDIRRSREGVLVRRGITAGGSTMLYSGNAYDPPEFLKEEYGLDLSEETAETRAELNIRPIPAGFSKDYVGTRRLVAAAGELGYAMTPQERFIDPERCDPACDRCLFGCRRGAKWTARSYVEDAREAGAGVLLRCDVREVLHAKGQIRGVRVKTPTGEETIGARRVVLAAGGMGTPMILHRSGVPGAGTHFFTDPMAVLLGVMKEGRGTFHEITYTFANESHRGEFVWGNTGAVNALLAQIAGGNLPAAIRGFAMNRLAGMFVKLCDEPTGRLNPDGSFHKTLTQKDEQTMDKGVALARSVMIRAGVRPETISVARGIGGHPGGTAAIGRVVGTDLQTDVAGLYVCDNSVMPRSGGIPPVLTLIALGKKFARGLLNN